MAIGSAGLDFAALLEAVALDPEAVLGKAARQAGRRGPAQPAAASRPSLAVRSQPQLTSLPSLRAAAPRAVPACGEATVPAVAKKILQQAEPQRAAAKLETALETTADRTREKARLLPKIAEQESTRTRTQRGKATEWKSGLEREAGLIRRSRLEQKSGLQSVVAPELAKQKTAKKKPPKSLRAAANAPWQSVPPAKPESLPQHAAALREELLADDTVAIGAAYAPSPAPVVSVTGQSEPSEAEREAAESVRRWPGPRRKSVTISVRLSASEAKMLRRRADESELSVSDYLRSCVLEADQLRAQVKQVLAEVRTRAPEAAPPVAAGAIARPAAAHMPRRKSRWRQWVAAMRSPLMARS